VPIIRKGNVIVVHHTAETDVATPTNALEVNLGRTRISRVWLFDEGDDDARVATNKYSVDLDAGILTFIDVSGLVGPIRIEHRIEDMRLVSDAEISGQLSVTRPFSHDFPIGSGVSSALLIGDMRARVSKFFDQQTWTGVWSDTIIGNPCSAEFNDTQYPVGITDVGTMTERWYLQFQTNTTVKIIGESVGQIAEGLSITETIAPVNPATNAPYFSLDPLGWGGGWIAGNILRMNTIGTQYPLWIVRTVQQGPASGDYDLCRIQLRGDANRL
jgi:hypothetical protein